MNGSSDSESSTRLGGLAGLLVARLRSTRKTAQRLVLVERVTLAPHQSLALVEAEGRRFLVATSAEGGPTFFALDEQGARTEAGSGRTGPCAARISSRVSW